MEFTLMFLHHFFAAVYLLMPLLFFLCLLISILGQVVGRIEGWSLFNSFYWSFITAMTVGYGDIRPLTKRSKLLSILITIVGIMFTGIIVAITISTTARAIEMHLDSESILKGEITIAK